MAACLRREMLSSAGVCPLFACGHAVGQLHVLEYHLRVHAQIYSPVAPDVSSVVLVVFVFVAFLVEILAQVLVRSVQKVVLAYGYPVELWTGVE